METVSRNSVEDEFEPAASLFPRLVMCVSEKSPGRSCVETGVVGLLLQASKSRSKAERGVETHLAQTKLFMR